MAKRVFGLFLICLMLAACMAVTGMAEEIRCPALRAEDCQVVEGQTVSVGIALQDNPGLRALSFRVDFDRRMLELVTAEDTQKMPGFAEPDPQSPLTFVWEPTEGEPFTGSEPIVDLTLKGRSAGTAKLTVTCLTAADGKGEPIELEGCTVEAAVLCDHALGRVRQKDDQNHEQVCTKCGAVCEEAHVWADVGKDEEVCSECGSARHDWSAWEQELEATCHSLGKEHRSCGVCGKTENRKLEMLPHSFGAWTFYSASNHVHTCTVCRKTEYAVHSYDEGELTREPTCKKTGEKTFTCADCGGQRTESVRPTELHNWGQSVELQKPSCKEEGLEQHTCLDCGLTETLHTAKTTDHQFGEWIFVDQENHKHICSVCGFEKHELHDWQKTVTLAATCTQPGTEETVCAAEGCGAAMGDTVVLPALGHELVLDRGCLPSTSAHGWKPYYACVRKDAFYEDQYGKSPIENLEEWQAGAGKLDVLPEYSIVEGAGASWLTTSGQDLRFRSDIPVSKFTAVLVDGEERSASDYQVGGDTNTTVVLKMALLRTLKTGAHSLIIEAEDGTAVTRFDVKEGAPVPRTGDDAKTALWIWVVAAGIVVLAVTLYFDRKKPYKGKFKHKQR